MSSQIENFRNNVEITYINTVNNDDDFVIDSYMEPEEFLNKTSNEYWSICVYVTASDFSLCLRLITAVKVSTSDIILNTLTD